LDSSLQFATNFEKETLGVKTLDASNRFYVQTGAFFSSGIAQSTPAIGLTLTASFNDGVTDPDYVQSTSVPGAIDVQLDTSGYSVTAVGGTATVTTGHRGTANAGYTCAVGNDKDRDSQCDTLWDKTGGTVNINGATLPIPEAGSTTFKDIYIDIVCMVGYCPSASDIAAIKGVFTNPPAPKAPADPDGISREYVAHVEVSPVGPAASFNTKVWSSASSSWLNGKQAHSSSDWVCDPNCSVTVSGLNAITTGPVTNARMDLNFTLTWVGTATPGTPTVTPGTITGKGSQMTTETLAINSVSPPVQLAGPVFKTNIYATVTYSTSGGDGVADTVAEGTFGSMPINIVVPAANSPKTIVSSPLPAIGLNSQIITTNTDYDGIIKNYFGSPKQRLDAGGTLGQGAKNMVALKAISHTLLYVRNIGADKFTCGSSGVSETPGRNSIIALGAKRDPTNAFDINCFSGSAGSSSEIQGVSIHELGHQLNLRHGGGDDLNCKPNYLSLMNYCYVIPRTGFGTFNLALSWDVLASLDERVAGTLSEAAGLQLTSKWVAPATRDIVYGNGLGIAKTATISTSPTPISWNGDISKTDTFHGFDLNYLSTVPGADISGTLSLLTGYSDFANMNLQNLATGASFYAPPGSDSSVARPAGDPYGKFVDAANGGIVTAPLTPLKYTTQQDLPKNVADIKKSSSVPVKLFYYQLPPNDANPITNADLKLRIFKMINTGTVAKPDYQIDPDMCNGKVLYTLNDPNPKAGQCNPTLGIVPKPGPPSVADTFRFDATQKYWIYNADTSIMDTSTNGVIYGGKVWLNGVNKPGGHLIDNGGPTPDSDGFVVFWRVTSK